MTYQTADELPCPECGYEGPHNDVDDSVVECGSCYRSIDITTEGEPDTDSPA